MLEQEAPPLTISWMCVTIGYESRRLSNVVFSALADGVPYMCSQMKSGLFWRYVLQHEQHNSNFSLAVFMALTACFVWGTISRSATLAGGLRHRTATPLAACTFLTSVIWKAVCDSERIRWRCGWDAVFQFNTHSIKKKILQTNVNGMNRRKR